MSEKSALQVQRESAVEQLSVDERTLYNEFKESGKPGLAPALAASLFERYLIGDTIYNIQKENPAFSLGSIVAAKVSGLWDEQRDRYVMELQGKAMSKLLVAQSEAVSFIADALAVTHKKYGAAFRRYVQTNNPNDLEGFDINNITAYAKTVEVLMKVTGQEGKKTVKVEGSVTTGTGPQMKDVTNSAPTPEMAAKLLAILGEE